MDSYDQRERVDFCHVVSEWNPWAGIRVRPSKCRLDQELTAGVKSRDQKAWMRIPRSCG